jgi:hypothetical protein
MVRKPLPSFPPAGKQILDLQWQSSAERLAGVRRDDATAGSPRQDKLVDHEQV